MNLMNRLPAKQIYLLSIIVLGIIALSIYSTYAIFTFEASTSDILSIKTPGSLSLMENITKYKQVTVPKDSVITTDVDIYNNFNYSLCYSVWYKTANEADLSKIKIYENNDATLTTSGTIDAVSSKRVKLLLINDSEDDVKVKLGLSYAENSTACELNISSDKKQISATLNTQNNLNNVVMNTQVKNSESGYLTYNDNETIVVDNDRSFMIGNSFDYKDEVFTLKETKTISINELSNYLNYYTCLDSDSCSILYRANEVSQKDEKYQITKYDKLIGYRKGSSGIRKVANNYYYYGDNPDNFIYYNCQNELDIKTCELWRIIGLAYDEESKRYLTKIIRDDYLNKQKYNDNGEEWTDSNIDKYLTKEYKLTNNLYQKELTFKQENITNLDQKLTDITYLDNQNKGRVMIMNLSDYLNASACTDKTVAEYTGDCLTDNWLNKGATEWTMTANYVEEMTDPETNEVIPGISNKVYAVGSAITASEVTSELNIRPVVYLKDRMLVTGGNGSFASPYIIR